MSLYTLKYKSVFAIAIIALLSLSVVMPSFAAEVGEGAACGGSGDTCETGLSCVDGFCEDSGSSDRGSSLGLDRLTGEGVEEFDAENAIQLGGTPLEQTIASLINTFIGLLGIVAVIIILIGGFQWMTAGGDDEKIGGAKKMIYAGVAGLAVILAAYAIAEFVIRELVGATGYGTP